jgi:SAM-dependent methyltransferase
VKLGYHIRLFFSRVRLYFFGTRFQWTRVVMDHETMRFMQSLPYRSMRALEISGTNWQKFGFGTYRYTKFSEYDWCAGPLDETFDIIIAEQVLEHVVDPRAALLNARAMLKSGGILVLTTPFLIRVHDLPADCSRWTEQGLAHLLHQCGFPEVETGSWGNRACVKANFDGWVMYVPWKHSLKNEPNFPVVVWAFARTSPA